MKTQTFFWASVNGTILGPFPTQEEAEAARARELRRQEKKQRWVRFCSQNFFTKSTCVV